MSIHRLPDRAVPRMPPYTTLELLQAEHKRLKELRDAGIFEHKRTQEEWCAHLATVLRPNFGHD